MEKRKAEFPERNEIRTQTEVDTHQPTATETSIRSVYSDTARYTVHIGTIDKTDGKYKVT